MKQIATVLLCFGLLLAGVIHIDHWEYTQKVKHQPELSIQQLITVKAREYNLDPDLMRAVVAQESNFNPRAGHRQLTSKDRTTGQLAGLNRAWGLCGIMGREAERRGVPWRELEDPETNLELCGAMLASCIETAPGKDKLGKVKRGLACHYSGKHKLTDQRPRPGEPSPREYVDQVLTRYLGYKI